MTKIGITTTVPVEIIIAAGYEPIDLNNIFITSDEAAGLVEKAEEAGYPRNICGWIKGIYAAVVNSGNVNKVIAVTQGDCSNTHALMETLQLADIDTIPFAYPYDRDYDLLKLQMDKLITSLGTDWQSVKNVHRRLRLVRQKVAEIDRLSWQKNLVSSVDNHYFHVCCSDFNGNVQKFEQEVDNYIQSVTNASPHSEKLRLGFVGVPPIFTDLYLYLEQMGARVVFNEVQRQFAMPYDIADIVEQYRSYTYPYGVFPRIEDIQAETNQVNWMHAPSSGLIAFWKC